MAFCHNSISVSATAPVLPVEFQMIFTIDTFTDLPHHISISIVHGIFTIRMKKSRTAPKFWKIIGTIPDGLNL